MAASTDEPKRSTYTGLFLTTLSLLQFELFLTRIFSVTMWYHFAFMAISLAISMKNGTHFRASTCENWEASRLDGD